MTQTYAENTKEHYIAFVFSETLIFGLIVCIICIITHQRVILKSNTFLHRQNIGI